MQLARSVRLLRRLIRVRLRTRLLLSLMGVSLLGVAIAGGAYHWSASSAFNQLVVDEAAGHFGSDVLNYYRLHGSLDRIEDNWGPPAPPFSQIGSGQFGPPGYGAPPKPQPKPGAGNPPPVDGENRPIPFGFADASGTVVLHGDGYTDGQPAPAQALRDGKPISVDGQRLGTVLAPVHPLPPSEAEAAYAGRINGALAFAALLGLVISTLVAVLLARGIVGPIQRLTAAARDMATGHLGQKVPAARGDELGELGRAFNRMSADLARYEQARQTMAAEIAHELRTPLTTISGYVEAMRDGELAPTVERLDSVFQQTHRLGRIIEDLRVLSMAEVGALRLERARISLSDIICQSVNAHALQASERGVGLRADVDPAVPEVEADPGRLQQVIEILVNNALRHTDQGEIVVSGIAEADAAVIRVADTGSGIEADVLPRIFDRFYRDREAQTRESGGSGLGLAIAKAIVGAHQGTIAVASQVAKGTVFTIRLPRQLTVA